ncbi:MAG: adenosylhomocysteinase [Legionellales bacterium]|nr:adenosylhomocysteinase [Legionellales bacterium]
MLQALLKYFTQYPQTDAPFMHKQFADWKKTRPLEGLHIVHHVPVVTNTLLKIACLVAAGAEVTVTNPSSFCTAQTEAIEALQTAGIRYVPELASIATEKFDLYFDCGAELYQALNVPRIGAIELTGSGDHYYRKHPPGFPVLSIDPTFTKQLETVFGCAESSHAAISQLTGINPATKSWIIFGFGKIGRGLAFFCRQHQVPVVVVDISPHQRSLAKNLGIETVGPQNLPALQSAVQQADIVVTATGKEAIMNAYPHAWFKDKMLANLGVYDEFGPQFSQEEVLNQKKPINFVLNDPTPIRYIDPEFYLHNMAALPLISTQYANGIHDVAHQLDKQLIEAWCQYHQFSADVIYDWFIDPVTIRN